MMTTMTTMKQLPVLIILLSGCTPAITLCGYVDDQPVKMTVRDSLAFKLTAPGTIRMVRCHKRTKLSEITPEMVTEITRELEGVQ